MQKRVLIACEYSGRVRDAFKAKGWYAMSCDLLPTENPGNHYQGSVFDVINGGYRCVNRETIQRVTVDGIIHFSN